LNATSYENLPGRFEGRRTFPYTDKKGKLCVKGTGLVDVSLACSIGKLYGFTSFKIVQELFSGRIRPENAVWMHRAQLDALQGAGGGSMTRRAGFTIIEVVVVLLVLGVVGVVVVAMAPSFNVFQATPEAEVIKGHLRYAQTMAMDTNTVWGINIAAGSYTLFNTITGSNPYLPGVGSATATLPAGMSITAGIVSFDKWGTPYTDSLGTVIQNAGGYRDFTLTLGTTTVVIQISDNTGFIP